MMSVLLYADGAVDGDRLSGFENRGLNVELVQLLNAAIQKLYWR